MDSNDKSVMIRNYSIAGFCIVLAILAIAFFLKIFVLWNLESPPINIWSECKNDSVNVFIGANENLKNAKCVALDKEFFLNYEVIIGDLSKNDEDVCRFELSRNTSQPLRFEVRYNDRVEREVCEWQHYSTQID